MNTIIDWIQDEDERWPALFTLLCDDLNIPPRTRTPLRRMIRYDEREWFVGVAYRLYNSRQQKEMQGADPAWWRGTLKNQRKRRSVRVTAEREMAEGGGPL